MVPKLAKKAGVDVTSTLFSPVVEYVPEALKAGIRVAPNASQKPPFIKRR